MLLTRVEVVSPVGQSADLMLSDVSSGYLVEEILGLGPTKAALVSTSFPNTDGEHYYTSKRESRNLNIKVRLVPDYVSETVSTLKEKIYNVLMTNAPVTLYFHLFDQFATNIFEQNKVLRLNGIVESNEIDSFSNTPVMNAVVVCHRPNYEELDWVTHEGESVNDMTYEKLVYPGSIDTGVVFTLKVNRSLLEDISIYKKQPGGSLVHVEFNNPMAMDDELVISSIFGDKKVVLKREGSEFLLLFALSSQSGWFNLHPGENQFRVFTLGDPVPYKIEYPIVYGGL